MANDATAEPESFNVRETAEKALESFENNPLALVLGGLAMGVIVGALLPRLAKESELLGPLGKRIIDSASAAALAARETGKAELEALIPDRNATKEKITELFGHVVEAAKDAAVHANSEPAQHGA